MKPTRPRCFSLMVAISMVAAACGGDASPDTTTQGGQDPDAISVVVTTSIWGEIVSNIVGDDANVEVLIPVGADPHEYQASSAQVAAMQQADLVIVNGLLLEEGMLDVIEGLETDGVNVLEVASGLDPIPFGSGGHADADHEDEDHDDEDHEDEGDHDHEDEDELTAGECRPTLNDNHEEEGEDDHEEEGHSHDEGSCDPHVWMDPLRIAEAVELIAAELAELDSSVDWMSRAESYAEELRSLHEEMVSTLSAIPEDRRKLVTNHEALGYFADRFDFEVVGTVISGGSTLSDPSSAELAELVDTIRDEDIRAVFAENIDPSALAEAVAAELGDDVEVVELFTDAVGAPGSGGETYIDMLRSNAELIARALS
ncbi:MAG: metal ABC transporter substrate-binding protein [Acidimicrobiia bacterium]